MVPYQNSTESEPTNSRPYAWLLIVGTLILLIAIAGAAYYFLVSSKENADQPARDAAGILDFQEAITEYESLPTTSASEEAEKNLRIGTLHNRADQYQQGVPILKSIVADENAPLEVRSQALALMGNIYYRGRYTEPLKFIFNDAEGIYANALDPGSVDDIYDLENALHKLYEHADSLSSFGYLKYALALKYAGELLDNESLTQIEREQHVEKIKELIKEGDQLMEEEASEPDYRESVYYDLWVPARQFRLYALSVLAREDANYVRDTDWAFQQLMGYYEQYPSPHVKVIEAYTRMYYAAYLADVFGETRSEDIDRIIYPTIIETGEYGKANSLSIWNFYERELNRPEYERNHNERFIRIIASHSDRFRDFLLNKNWLKVEGNN